MKIIRGIFLGIFYVLTLPVAMFVAFAAWIGSLVTGIKNDLTIPQAYTSAVEWMWDVMGFN